MAYVSQEFKKQQAPIVKAICQKYGVKGSLSVNNHSTLVLTIREGKIDFLSRFADGRKYHSVNVYWYQEHFDGVAKQFLTEVIEALKGPDFFDHSDIQTDYFHRSHYYDINIGRWDKPYKLVE